MRTTGLDVFDKTLQTTNIWLGEIMQTLGPDRRVAWHALGSVLHALRDRLPLTLAVHLGAQLPLLIRGLYYDRWRPSAEPRDGHALGDFLALVAAALPADQPVDPKDAAIAVFQVLQHYVDPNHIANIREALPEEVRLFWPSNGEEMRSAAWRQPSGKTGKTSQRRSALDDAR